MPSLSHDELMRLTPECTCCRRRLTRIILASTEWNDSGDYLFHCLQSGRITPIGDLEAVIRTDRQEGQK